MLNPAGSHTEQVSGIGETVNVRRLFIFGLSGFARETNDLADALGYQSTFIAVSAAERDEWRGDEPVVLESEIGALAGEAFAIGIADTRIRQKIANRYSDLLNFPSLIHPSATFGKKQRPAVEAQRGSIVCAGARFMSGIRLGDFAVVGLNATIGHDAVLGDCVTVAPGANISGHVHLGDRVWVGANATINQGLPGAPLGVGAGTTIGSGAVVLRDCDADSVYSGVPARKH